MEIFTIGIIVVGIILFFTFGRFLIHSMKALLVLLVVVFGLVFFFGVSYNDLIDWGAQLVLWVF